MMSAWEDDSDDEDPALWAITIDLNLEDSDYWMPDLHSGKWYSFPKRLVLAFPANAYGYLSAAIQSSKAVETTVYRAKYVGTLDLCRWFPRRQVMGHDVRVQGIDEICQMEDVCIFLQIPPETNRIAGAVWIAFALLRSDVTDFELDHV